MLNLGAGHDNGAVSPNGRVQGCYVHGLFGSDDFRAHWLARFCALASGQSYEDGVEETLDALARHLEAHLDIDAIIALAR